ncbi:hypothetical protein EQG49_06350 [Periweissella cryptocerci]|uniref:NADH oxidase n=2 Tax=Periweissella cryptocerci TaxID=2506420 RepID=A0A4P6YTU1_9LACO|nr:hypothetical protein EQG49_06350 [Periweissella cryptocerci]
MVLMGLFGNLFKSKEKQKVVVLGLNGSSAAALSNIIYEYPDVQIDVYTADETKPFVTAVPAYMHKVKDEFSDADIRFVTATNIQQLSESIHIHNHTLFGGLDTNSKRVTIQNLDDETEELVTYDKLLYALPAVVSLPDIPGIFSRRILPYQNAADFLQIETDLKRLENSGRAFKGLNIAIFGQGYDTAELAVRAKNGGANVTYIAARNNGKFANNENIFRQKMLGRLEEFGVKVIFEQDIRKFEEDGLKVKVNFENGEQVVVDYVFALSTPVPDTKLLRNVIDLGKSDEIIVNEYLETSQADVLASGSSTGIGFAISRTFEYLPMQKKAIRQGAVAGLNMFKRTAVTAGTQSSSGVNVFGMSFYRTGMSVDVAENFDMSADSVTITDQYRPEYMKTNETITITLVYDRHDRIILGAQLMSMIDIAQSVNTLTIAIQNRMTIDELSFVDMLFQPNFDRPFNYLNLAAQAAVAKEASVFNN